MTLVLRSQVGNYVQENSANSISMDLEIWLKKHPGRINSLGLQKYLNDEIDWNLALLAARNRSHGRLRSSERSSSYHLRQDCLSALDYLGLKRVRVSY